MTSNEPTSERDGLLREGARLLYTVAAGQMFELGDINAWFARYNAVVESDRDTFGDPFGAIGQRQSESDPLIDAATAALDDLAGRAASARDDFAQSVAAAQQGGGS